MDAVLATIVAGGRARIRLNTEVGRNKFISTLIYGIYLIALMAAWERTCARPPTPQAAWLHQIHATGGASGPTTHGDGIELKKVVPKWYRGPKRKTNRVYLPNG